MNIHAKAQCFTAGTRGYRVDTFNTNIYGLQAADFMGKGYNDLLIGNSFINYPYSLMNIYANDGKGNFTLDTSLIGWFREIADMNGDGRPDILMSYSDGVYINDGNGKFHFEDFKPKDFLTEHLQFRDLNNDGKADAFQLLDRSNLFTFMNLGQDSFSNSKEYTLPFTVNLRLDTPGHWGNGYDGAYEIADYNHDHFNDALFCTQIKDSGFIVLYKNNDSGYLISDRKIFVPFSPLAIHLSDVNGDSLPDILVGDSSGQLHVMIQDSSGNFQQTAVANGYGNNYFYKMTTADLNRDGKTDLVTMLENGDLEMYYGNGKGEIDSAKHIYFRGNLADYSLRAVDMNGDNAPDIVLIDVNHMLCLMLNDGKGNLGTPYVHGTDDGTRFDITKEDKGFGKLSIADANGDGKPDLLLSDNDIFWSESSSIGLKILTYEGNNLFKTDTYLYRDQEIFDATFADFNNDGVPDICFQDGTSLATLINEGNFHFLRENTLGGTFVSSPLVLGDFNKDRYMDAALADQQNKKINLYLNDKTGRLTFWKTLTTTLGVFYAYKLETGDFNNDGITDFAILSENDAIQWKVELLLSDEKGNFTDYIVPSLFGFDEFVSRPMAIADFNGDGYLDFGVVDRDSLSIFINDKTGHFPKHDIYDVGQGDVLSLFAGDLNGDNKSDLILSSGKILYNRGDGTFQTRESLFFYYPFSNFVDVNDMAIADLNNDDKNDVVVEYASSDELKYYLNCDSGTFTSLPVQSLEQESDLNIFPNPSTGSFTIKLNSSFLKNNRAELSVYNSVGEKVQEQEINSLRGTMTALISINEMRDGIYFIRIQSGGKTWHAQVLKQ